MSASLRTTLVAAVSFAVLTTVGLSAAAAATFTGLGDLPGGDIESRANSISADGQVVVGESESANDREAFTWTEAGGMVGLGDLPGTFSESKGYGASRDGSVIVGQGFSTSPEAYVWTQAGGMVGLGFLPNTQANPNSTADAVAADTMVIVGRSSSGDGAGVDEAFRWTEADSMVGLGYLEGGAFFSYAVAVSADGSVVAGYSDATGGGFEAFRWTEAGGMVGLGFTNAWALSDDGSTVAGTDGQDGVVWTEAGGVVSLLTRPPDIFSIQPRDITADGSVIVGTVDDLSVGRYAFIWDATNGLRNLNDVLVNDHGIDLTGWVLEDAKGISADGLVITGVGENASGDNEAWVAVLDGSGPSGPSAPSADFTGDGKVDFNDFLVFVQVFGKSEGQAGFDSKFDLTQDGRIDFNDFLEFVTAFGT